MIKRIIALLICFCFISEQTGYAQVAGQFAVPAYLSNLAPVADRFRPVQLRSIEFEPAAENFQLLLDKGDLKSLTPGQVEESSQKLFEYFKIGLALPNSMFWVNLRPDSPDNVIDPYLEKTDLGKVLLEADLQLKKDLARFTNPDTAEGRRYWNKLYEKAAQIYSGQDIEIPTFTRPWIVPGEIIIRESPQGAFIYKATLKVMLEQDYIKDPPFYHFDDPKVKELNEYSSDLVRQLIIPKLTKEVNSSRRYGRLRQVYYSLVLAQWFKSRNKESMGIDQKDMTGFTSNTPWSRAAYFDAYKKSFSEGEYRKEETINSQYGVTVRQYFSGGIQVAGGSSTVISASSTEPPAMAGVFLDGGARRVSGVSKRLKQSLVSWRNREISWPWRGKREVDESKAHPRTLIDINTIPDELKPGKVLDLGCGSGDLSLLLALARHEVVGLDLSGKQIELARAKREQCSAPESKNSVFKKNGQSYDFLFYMYEPYRHFEGPGTILKKSDDQYSAQELKEAEQRLVFVPGNFNDPEVIAEILRTFGEFENIVVSSPALYMTPLGLLDSAQGLLAAQGRLVVQISDIRIFDLDALVWRSDGRLESAWLTQSFSKVRQQKPDNHFVSFYDLAEAAGFTLAREFITVEDGAFYLVFDKTREFDREKINALYEGSLTVKEYKAFLNRMSWRRIANVVHDALAPLSKRLASEEDEFERQGEADIKQALRESKDPLEPFRVNRRFPGLPDTRWIPDGSADGGKILEGGNAAHSDGGDGETAEVIIAKKTIGFSIPSEEVRADDGLSQKAIDKLLSRVDSLIAGTELEGLAYVEPFTIGLREFDKKRIGSWGDVAWIREETLKTLVWKLAANGIDAFRTFKDKEYWEKQEVVGMPPIPEKGELILTASWAIHPNGKECLKIAIKDNGAGKYAADTERKWLSLGNNFYLGGYGLDSRMIRFGNSETGAQGLLAFLWEKAGVKVGKNAKNEDNTDDFYQARYNEDGWGSTVTVWLPRACFKNIGEARKDGGSDEIDFAEAGGRLTAILDRLTDALGPDISQRAIGFFYQERGSSLAMCRDDDHGTDITLLKWFVDQYRTGKVAEIEMAYILAHELAHIKNDSLSRMREAGHDAAAWREIEIRDFRDAVDLMIRAGYEQEETVRGAVRILRRLDDLKAQASALGKLYEAEQEFSRETHPYEDIARAIEEAFAAGPVGRTGTEHRAQGDGGREILDAEEIGEIRFARPEDINRSLDAVLELVNSVPQAQKYNKEELLEKLKDPASKMIFNFIDDNPVALIWVYKNEDQTISWDRMATKEKYRGQGRATRLLSYLAQGFPGITIRIPINEANETYNWYDRMGFRRVPSGEFREITTEDLRRNIINETTEKNPEPLPDSNGPGHIEPRAEDEDVQLSFLKDSYPDRETYLRHSKKEYSIFFRDMACKQDILDTVRGHFGRSFPVTNIQITFAGSGASKDIFKIAVQYDIGGSLHVVNMCLAALRPYINGDPAVLEEVTEYDYRNFHDEFAKKKEFIIKARDMGVPETIVPALYSSAPAQVGIVRYYLQEWIGGPTASEQMAAQGLSLQELRDIYSAWMSIIRVLGKKVGDPHGRNIKFREDGSLTIVDLGVLREPNLVADAAMMLEQLYAQYNPQGNAGSDDRPKASRLVALFEGVLVGLGKRQGMDFLNSALAQSRERGNKKMVHSIEAFLRDGGMQAPGGIDFRALPASGQSTQPGATMPHLTQELQSLANASKMQDLDKEWKEIEVRIRLSEMPYARMKEYVAVCACLPDAGEHLEKAVGCIMNILRLEEEQGLATRTELTDILVCIG